MATPAHERRVLGKVELVFPEPRLRRHESLTAEHRERLAALPDAVVASLERLCLMVRDVPVLRGEDLRNPATPAKREKALERVLDAVENLERSIDALPGAEAATLADHAGGKDLGRRLNDDLAALKAGTAAKLAEVRARKRKGPREQIFKSQFVEMIETCLEPAGLRVALNGPFHRIVEVCFDFAGIHRGAEPAIEAVLERRRMSSGPNDASRND